MKRIASLIFFLLSALVVQSQAEPSIAELKQQLTSARDTMRIVLLNQLANKYTYTSADSAIMFGRQTLELSRKQNARRYEVLARNNIGWGYRMLGQTDSAQFYFESGLALARQIRDARMIYNLQNSLGVVFEDRQQYEQALELYRKSHDIAVATKWDRGICTTLSNQADVYTSLADYPRAIELYQSALIIEERAGLRKETANTSLNMSHAFFELGQYSNAMEYTRRGLLIFRQMGDIRNEATACNTLGVSLYALKLTRQAVDTLQLALALAQQIGDHAVIALSLGNLAIIYKDQGDYGKALGFYNRECSYWEASQNAEGLARVYGNIGECYLRMRRTSDAERYLSRSLSTARSAGALDQQANDLLNLSELSELQGKYRQALSYLRQSVGLKDSLVGRDVKEKVSLLEARFGRERQQRTIDLQQLQLSRSRLLVMLLMTGLALLGVVLALLFQRFRHLLAFWKRKTHIGHYRIIGQIGSGGMGVVYKAAHLMDHSRPVAVKVIREELANDPVLRKRFLHEAAVIDQLDHPHIVKVLERGEYHQALFIAMELLEGRSLDALIAARQPIPLGKCCMIMSQLADAVATIHAKGIVHRDLKPENVMLVERDGDPEYVKLLDFGLARNQALSRMTMTGEIVGTLHYLAPEQVTQQEATAASDVYSLGVIFYELVTGVKPFIGKTPIEIVQQIVGTVPLGPRHFRPDLPPALDQLIGRMLDKDPARRPSGGDVVAAIRDCLGKERA